VQHSVNGSVWADLVTFAQVTTTPTKERVVVAAGTTVNRYLRGNWTKGGAGSPSYVFCVGFGRR
jgi:NAD/NADP transhydrogenase alpha subunit